MQVQSLGREDLLELEMATHSRLLPGKIPWTEEPGGLQSLGCKGLDMTEVAEQHTHSTEYRLLIWIVESCSL